MPPARKSRQKMPLAKARKEGRKAAGKVPLWRRSRFANGACQTDAFPNTVVRLLGCFASREVE